jgi:hypothetical protein
MQNAVLKSKSRNINVDEIFQYCISFHPRMKIDCPDCIGKRLGKSQLGGMVGGFIQMIRPIQC